MKNIKKPLFKCLAIAMAATLSLTIAGCSLDGGKSEKKKEREFIEAIGGVSETYQGAVSTQSYNTASAAAQAFVQEEVVGEQTATVVNTKSNGELSQQQINDLNLPKEIQTGILSVEKMEVEYTLGATSYTSTPESQNKTIVVYVIRYADAWKYYTPAPITGETISKSYYNSVFNQEKEQNCTMTTTTSINVNVMLVINADVTMTQTVQHDNGKILLEQKMTISALGEEQSEYVGLYLETVGNGIECNAKTSETEPWQKAQLNKVGFNSVDELAPFYDSYLDYSYFVKTDYGFRMTDDNAQQYIRETLEQEDTIKQYLSQLNDLNMDLFIKYYVSEGVLTGVRQDGSCTVTTNIDSFAATMARPKLQSPSKIYKSEKTSNENG